MAGDRTGQTPVEVGSRGVIRGPLLETTGDQENLMPSTPWPRPLATLLVASVLLPPVGLVLLWLRSETRLRRKVLGSAVILMLGVVYLQVVFGLRIERDGSGLYPIFSFQERDHYTELERNRSEHRAVDFEASPAPGSPVRGTASGAGIDTVAAETATTIPAGTTSASALGSYWTDYRGPKRDGRYEKQILTDWPSGGLPLLWKQPIGGGYASFVIAEGKAFTIEQRRRQEVVAAYDLETGRELWTHAWNAEFREAMGGDGPRATPTWHEGRLYALGAIGELRCLEATSGKLIWSRNILTDNQSQNLTWGMSASPLVVDEKLIVLPGGTGKSVVAYHKRTGEYIWKALNDKQAYTSPMLVTLAGQRQILVVSARRAMGLTVEDGSVLWDHPWVTNYDINAAQPIVLDENRFFLSAGYGHGATVVEVARTGNGFRARTVWENNSMKNKFNSSVLYAGHIYGLDEGILACVNAETGQRVWKGGRYGYGQLLLASGHLIVLSEQGDVALVKATPERHLELARFSAIIGKTWNYPAMDGGRLLVRNGTEMACFRISAD